MKDKQQRTTYQLLVYPPSQKTTPLCGVDECENKFARGISPDRQALGEPSVDNPRSFVSRSETAGVKLNGTTGLPVGLHNWGGVVFSLLLVVCCVSLAFAQEISFTAEVDKSQVPLGSSVRLSLHIEGTQEVAPLQLPSLDKFDVQYRGPSRSFSIVNGQVSSSITFNYSLFPSEVGQFEIPSFTVMINGKTYTTQPIPIKVIEEGQTTSPQNQQGAVTIQDKIFLVLNVPKKEVYLNEPLPIKIMLFVSDLAVRDIQYPQLNNAGWTFGKYGQPKQSQQIIKGVRYDIVEFDTVIYPTRKGELTLGPAELECNLLVRDANRQSAFDGFDRFFNDDFFNNLFDHYQKRPIALKSEETVLNVLELPADGKPQSFSGGVGQFAFDLTVSPPDVKEGDPITLRMTIEGKGNLSAVEFPHFKEQEEIKLYEPNIKEEEGKKIFEQVIIPMSHNLKELPAIEFSYFDPELKKYHTIKEGPFPINVRPLQEGEQLKVVGLEESLPDLPEALGQDIVFIKDDMGRLRRAGIPLYRQPGYIIFVGLSLGIWTALYLAYQRRHRLQTDLAYARAFQAPRKAKKGLLQAQQSLNSGHTREFYDTLFKTFQHYLSNKFQLAIGAVTYETLVTKLNDTLESKDILYEIKAIFEQADVVRYASVQIDQQTMQENYYQVEKVIDYLERNVK